MDQRWSALMNTSVAASSTPEPTHSTGDAQRGASRRPIVLAGVFISYVILAQVGFALAGQATMTPPFRPTGGLAVAALVLLGVGAWPAVSAGSLIVAFGVTQDPMVSTVSAGAHPVGEVIPAVLINRFAGGREVFRAIRTTLRALFFILVAAFIPAATLALSGPAPGALAGETWSTALSGWLGQATGTVVGAPCVLIMLTPVSARPKRWRGTMVAEGTAVLVSLSVVALAVFAGVTP